MKEALCKAILNKVYESWKPTVELNGTSDIEQGPEQDRESDVSDNPSEPSDDDIALLTASRGKFNHYAASNLSALSSAHKCGRSSSHSSTPAVTETHAPKANMVL